MGKLEKDFLAAAEQEAGFRPAELERLTIVLIPPSGTERDRTFIFGRATKPVDKKTLLERMPAALKRSMTGEVLGKRDFVIATSEDVRRVLAGKPEKATGLAAALELAAKGHAVVVGVNPQALPVSDDLPPEVAPFKPLLKAKSASLVVDVGAKVVGRARVSFGSAEQAAEGEKAAGEARKLGRSLLDGLMKTVEKNKAPGSAALKDLVGQLQGALKAARLTRKGKDLTAEVGLKLDPTRVAAMAAGGALRVRAAAQRIQSTNNLRQIGLAFFNYLDKVGTFPPHAVFDKDGKALLSWRVLLLPYRDQLELYKEFKLDEPWDSKHNKKLLAKMPAVFRATGDKQVPAGHTFYQAFVGKGAAFEGKRGLRIADFLDGTSNTMTVAEAAKAVPWTRPEDLSYDPDKPLPKVGGLWQDGFYAAFGDGSVRFIRKTTKEATLRALITRNGGEPIPRDE